VADSDHKTRRKTLQVFVEHFVQFSDFIDWISIFRSLPLLVTPSMPFQRRAMYALTLRSCSMFRSYRGEFSTKFSNLAAFESIFFRVLEDSMCISAEDSN